MKRQELKTKYKYVFFNWIEDKPKTSVWQCRNQTTGGLLGIVKWYNPWRQYCFYPESDCVFNMNCLEDINDFIGQLSKL